MRGSISLSDRLSFFLFSFFNSRCNLGVRFADMRMSLPNELSFFFLFLFFFSTVLLQQIKGSVDRSLLPSAIFLIFTRNRP